MSLCPLTSSSYNFSDALHMRSIMHCFDGGISELHLVVSRGCSLQLAAETKPEIMKIKRQHVIMARKTGYKVKVQSETILPIIYLHSLV